MICGKILNNSQGQLKLLKYVHNNDIRSIERIVHRHSNLLSAKYHQPHEEHPILILACNDPNVKGETIAKLIELGASCTEPTENDHWEAIHYAAIQGDKDKLRAIIKHLTTEQANSLVYCSTHVPRKFRLANKNVKKSYSNNALNILLKYARRNESFLECCQQLIDKGVRVHQADSNGVSPLDLLKNEDKLIASRLVHSQQSESFTKDAIFALVMFNKEEEFLLKDFSQEEVNGLDGSDENFSSCTLMQMCCAKGLTSCVKHILSKGASPNKTIRKNETSPIMIAIKEDHEEIVELFLDNPGIELPEDILIKMQTKYKHMKNVGRIDKYMTLVLNHLTKYEKDKIRRYLLSTDDLDRTALHYATNYRCSDNVLKLLEMGAPLTKKDSFDSTPLHSIEPNVLEKFFDRCIALPKDTKDLDNMLFELKNYKKMFPIEINYEALIGGSEKNEVNESEFLFYLIKIANLTHLLNHPVISSYLAVKWTKFRWAVYINLLLYLIAYVSLLFYGFAYENYATASNGLLLTSLCFIFTRESVQLTLFRTDYLKRLDNIVDLLLIGGVIYIIASGWTENVAQDDYNLRVAFSVVFLTSTLGIFMQLGILPFFTIKVIILRQTSISFCKYMVFYIFPVLAFFFCFYMLRDNPDPKDNMNDFFHILYDVITMFAGDPDSNYPSQFETNPIFSHIIYVCFIVIIGIILQNLLIGLAVSDLQEIQKKAEFISKKEIADYITNIERIIFSNLLKSTNSIFRSIFKKLLRTANVFQDDKILVIQPYNDGCVYTHKNPKSKQYIKDQAIIEFLQNVIKDLTLAKDREVESTYSLKMLYEKLERIENVLEKLDVNNLLKK
ncbi:hypothetical protein Zmor_010917 [Zophobas morio]|uniref:Ion transport domain-containing protein n=2 Tax=Zophobas morio TaxID=2755281 RepID=A0AA38ISG7_9CUCU|nr:hypothetical protein Zmor_010917 [Zophobas morio]